MSCALPRLWRWNPRPSRRRQPGATTLRGAGSPAALLVARALARFAGKAARAEKKGRANRENRGARNQMQRRCADRLVSPFRRVDNFETTPRGEPWASAIRHFAGSIILKPPPGGSHEQARTQIILKTDERSAVLELDRDGEFAAKSNGWDENRVSSRATSSRSRSRTGVGCWPASRRGAAGGRASTALFR